MSKWEGPGKTDEWYTPSYIFDALAVDFDLDVASNSRVVNVPSRARITSDSLEKDWRGFVWMNPPFGKRNGLVPWLEKFIAHGDGICLVPDRTSAPWFQKYMSKMDAILFMNGKVKFENPVSGIGKHPGNGTALGAIGEKGVGALSKSGLGMVFLQGSQIT